MQELALRELALSAPRRPLLRVVSPRRRLDPAQRALVLAHRGLVAKLAKSYGRHGAWVDDLIQEGSLGLMKAAEHFDPSKGTRFDTYAKWWIRTYLHRCPPDGTGWTLHKGKRSNDVSLDGPLNHAGDASALENLIDPDADPEQAYLARERDRGVRAELSRLKKRLGGLGWDIVQKRFSNDSPETLDIIGRRWNLSRERVRQVEIRTRALLIRQMQAD